MNPQELAILAMAKAIVQREMAQRTLPQQPNYGVPPQQSYPAQPNYNQGVPPQQAYPTQSNRRLPQQMPPRSIDPRFSIVPPSSSRNIDPGFNIAPPPNSRNVDPGFSLPWLPSKPSLKPKAKSNAKSKPKRK
jgi:hypothetical protein